MDRLKHPLTFLLLISIQFCFAQLIVPINETVFVHTNATTFVSGENLQYKVYCLKISDKKPSLISKIAYLELINSENKSVFKSKIALTNGVGNNDYFIPTSLNSGNYKLIAYTNWMLNKDVATFFTIDITIFNPYKVENQNQSIINDKTSVLNNLSSNNSTNENAITNQNLNISTDKKTYLNRELVTLKIEALSSLIKDGNYSLSVRKIDDLPTKKQTNASSFVISKNEKFIDLQNQNTKIILPELRGEIVSGKITAKNKTDKLDNVIVALSLPGISYDFKIVKTDDNGCFLFSIDSNAVNNQVSIQILGDLSKLYDIALDNNAQLDFSKLYIEKQFSISESLKQPLIDRSIASQIKNSYYKAFRDSIKPPNFKTPFYNSLAKGYVLDDFTRFKTLKETATEVATEIYFKQIENNTFIHVTDPTIFPQLQEPALVLIDGLFLKNQNDLMKYNMKNISKIDIITGRYYLGPKSFNGLVSFTTFKKDFTPASNENYVLNEKILRPDVQKIYKKTDYSDVATKKRIPDYSYQLLWEPNLNLSSNTTLLNFYTTDVAGKFEINIEGFGLNGEPISYFKYFEVN